MRLQCDEEGMSVPLTMGVADLHRQSLLPMAVFRYSMWVPFPKVKRCT